MYNIYTAPYPINGWRWSVGGGKITVVWDNKKLLKI